MATLTDAKARQIAAQAIAAHMDRKVLKAEEIGGARLAARDTRRRIAAAEIALAQLIDEIEGAAQ